MATDRPENKVLIHIIVVGFHHKKGCQIEFCYPPFDDGGDINQPILPEEWKCLPFLALPDGAHNYDEDTIYFHLPPRSHYHSKSTVYGVSCYRQIAASLLKRKDSDVTRETVQKSVLALSQLPIYGILHAKLKMITQAYFEEKDFAKNDILKELFIHMNLQISGVDDSKRYFGLTPRSLVLRFQHEIVVLFKLILLERRVLFYTSPVQKLVGGIMSLLSLFPNMIEKGLAECTVSLHDYQEQIKQHSSDLNVGVDYIRTEQASNNIIPRNIALTSPPEKESDNDLFKNVSNAILSSTKAATHDINQKVKVDSVLSEQPLDGDDGIIISSLIDSNPPVLVRHSSTNLWEATSEAAINIAASVTSRLESLSSTFSNTLYREENFDDSRFDSLSEIEDDDEEQDKLHMGFQNARLEIKSESPSKNLLSGADSSSKNTFSQVPDPAFFNLEVFDDCRSHFQTDEHGFPLSVFSRGYLCLPYVALQQFSDLTNNYERGYVIGATNVLFKTQAHLADVVIDMENALLDIRDLNLKRQLHLSAADLRFAQNLVNNVYSSPEDDVFFDATGWEGGDEWIQAQFSEYLVSLLALSVADNPNPKDLHDFNEHFISAWKSTKNYQIWASETHKGMTNAKPLHPCQAQYSVNDMRLRFHHNLQSTDRGRKIEGAMNSANQAVVNTGKYMGTALISAKSTVSSWWSNRMKKDTGT